MAAVFAGRPPALAGQCVVRRRQQTYSRPWAHDVGPLWRERCSGSPRRRPSPFCRCWRPRVAGDCGGSGPGCGSPFWAGRRLSSSGATAAGCPCTFPCPSTQAPPPSSSGWSRRRPPSGGLATALRARRPGGGKADRSKRTRCEKRFLTALFCGARAPVLPGEPPSLSLHQRGPKAEREDRAGDGQRASRSRPAVGARAPPRRPPLGEAPRPRSTGSPDCGFQWEWSCLMSPIR